MLGERFTYRIEDWRVSTEIEDTLPKGAPLIRWMVVAYVGDTDTPNEERTLGPFDTKADAEAAALKAGIGFMDLRG